MRLRGGGGGGGEDLGWDQVRPHSPGRCVCVCVCVCVSYKIRLSLYLSHYYRRVGKGGREGVMARTRTGGGAGCYGWDCLGLVVMAGIVRAWLSGHGCHG